MTFETSSQRVWKDRSERFAIKTKYARRSIVLWGKVGLPFISVLYSIKKLVVIEKTWPTPTAKSE